MPRLRFDARPYCGLKISYYVYNKQPRTQRFPTGREHDLSTALTMLLEVGPQPVLEGECLTFFGH